MSEAAQRGQSAIAHGLAWNGAAQVLQIALALASTSLLARVIAPHEYGRAVSVAAFVALLNVCGCSVFIAHALQQPADVEPDWELYFAAAVRTQSLLCAIGEVVASLAWLSSRYRPVAPLLHVASLGLLLDAPAQLRFAQLRRALDWKRLRITIAIGTTCATFATVMVALGGGGAYALVLGASVFTPLPLAIDLLVVQRFVARRRAFRWSDVREALRFGVSQSGLGLLYTLRSTAPGAILPSTLGYDALATLGRSQSTVQLGGSRIFGVVLDTVYPLLPQHANDPPRQRRDARTLATLLGCGLIPPTIFFACRADLVVRVLYGDAWHAVVVLVPAAALAFVGQIAMTLGSMLWMANGRLRWCFAIDAIATALVLVTAALSYAEPLTAVAWGLAIAHACAGLFAVLASNRWLARGWVRGAVVVPAIVSTVGVLVVRVLPLASLPLVVRLGVEVAVYVAAVLLVARVGFASLLVELLEHAPGGRTLARLLRV